MKLNVVTLSLPSTICNITFILHNKISNTLNTICFYLLIYNLYKVNNCLNGYIYNVMNNVCSPIHLSYFIINIFIINNIEKVFYSMESYNPFR